MITRLLAVLVLSVTVLEARSQPPTPSARKSGSSQEQPKPESAQQQPAEDPRGTDTTPLIVKVQPATKTDEEAQKERAKEDAEASAKRWTVGLGVATGLLGLFQLGAIGFQAWIASKQNEIIGKQNEIMEGQRKAADKQSEYMRDALAESCKASEAAMKSADIADKALRLSERAHLAFGHYEIQHLEDMTKDIRISYAIINTGRTPAFLLKCDLGFKIAESLSADVKYNRPTTNEGAVPVYNARPLLRPININSVSEPDRRAVLDGKKHLWFYGGWVYRDVFNTEHTSHFILTYEGGTLVLDTDHPQYNYAT